MNTMGTVEVDQSSASPMPRKPGEYPKRRRGSLLVIILFFLVLVCAAAAAYFYWQLREQKDFVSQRSAVDVVAEVGKILVLPSDEQPTVATVNDIEKLKGQPFFAKARVGFKVLIYSKNQKVILYDPEARKIVEMGSLKLETPIE